MTDQPLRAGDSPADRLTRRDQPDFHHHGGSMRRSGLSLGILIGVLLTLAIARTATAQPHYLTVNPPFAGKGQLNLVQPFLAGGWALSLIAPPGGGTGVTSVDVYAQPFPSGPPRFIGVATYGISRPDVAAIFGAQFQPSGWQIVVRGLPEGYFTIFAVAHNIDGSTQTASANGHGYVSSTSVLVMDSPDAGGVTRMPAVFSGWAVNYGSAGGTGIDRVMVYAYRDGTGPATLLGDATYGLSRPDVAAAIGAQFVNSGWSIPVNSLTPGLYTIVAYARDTVSQLWASYAWVYTIVNSPVVTAETPPAGSAQIQPFTLTGYALDLGAGSFDPVVFKTGIDSVVVYAYPDIGSGAPPVLVGVATYGLPRADVASLYGSRYTNSGYRIDVNGLPGGHIYTFAIFGHSMMRCIFGSSAPCGVGEIYFLRTHAIAIP
jgi:hypothetical protein